MIVQFLLIFIFMGTVVAFAHKGRLARYVSRFAMQATMPRPAFLGVKNGRTLHHHYHFRCHQ